MKYEGYVPSYTITDNIINLIAEISELDKRLTGSSDQAADSGPFVEFLLHTIYATLQQVAKTVQVSDEVTVQVKKLLHELDNDTLSAKELMERVGLKHRPTFRENSLSCGYHTANNQTAPFFTIILIHDNKHTFCLLKVLF